MKLSCIPVCFFAPIFREKTMTREDWLKIAVELGLDGTEIYETFVEDLDATGLGKFADVVHNYGLKVSMFSREDNFTNPAEREKAVAQVKRSIDAAAILGTKFVRVTAGCPHSEEETAYIRNTKREDIVRSCVEGLRGCLDYAEKKNIMLAIEDHHVVGWDVEEFMKILDMLDDERMKVNLDTSNVSPGTVLDLTRRVAKRVVHLHVKDRRQEDGRQNHRIVIGTGEVDLKGIFSILKKAGFDGWMSLEALGGGKEELKQGIKNVREAWNKI